MDEGLTYSAFSVRKIADHRRGASATPTTAQHDGLQTPNGTLSSAAAASRLYLDGVCNSSRRSVQLSALPSQDFSKCEARGHETSTEFKGRGPVAAVGQSPSPDTALRNRARLIISVKWTDSVFCRTWSGGGCRPESLSRHGSTNGAGIIFFFL
ncbi:uncharacterized protein LOC122380906 isoform X3 [Amphibalanus amphitrite]|uniref:uncharacterized protein LOC122380906 isoform X3 n=1 Tax=Amphibalanus amphitrite TaxID=1232801 RepID=UPI001C9110EA|nr:uncharacterized protein LOC122380906 isoform X3 [Amphibalanus amphitrite]